MAENFLVHPEEHVIWFVECCSDLELSKTLFIFVLLQSLCIKPKGLLSPSVFELHIFRNSPCQNIGVNIAHLLYSKNRLIG